MVRWNNQPLATTFISSTQLSATVPGSDMQTSAYVVLRYLVLRRAAVCLPLFRALCHGTCSGADHDISKLHHLWFCCLHLDIDGIGFPQQLRRAMEWRGNLPTTFINSTQLTALIPAADVLAAGTAPSPCSLRAR